MDKFKEFQGKDLDECIQEACGFFNCPREKLEIEILQDAKSGVFGIIGARKAKIRARRAQLPENIKNFIATPDTPAREENRANPARPEKVAKSRREGENRERAEPRKNPEKKGKKMEAVKTPAHASHENEPPRENRKKVWQDHGAPHPLDEERCDDLDEVAEGLRVRPLEELDADTLKETGRRIVCSLVRPIAGRDVDVAIDLSHGRVRAKVDWQGDAGLLIGREGQTLCALQYLASRMLSRAMDAALRVRLDIGDYRSRQDEKLRELAKALADKARATGRSFSTRPLSSYHRRVIHICLQDDGDVITRSSGEGPLKRVVIAPKRFPGRV